MLSIIIDIKVQRIFHPHLNNSRCYSLVVSQYDVCHKLTFLTFIYLFLSYRKYRPHVFKYKGNYKQWWHFAYTCILEEDIRRRRRNWLWSHMKQHRNLCRSYAAVYRAKLTSNKGKLTQEQLKLLEDCEKTIDIFNLVVIRQQIEMEVRYHSYFKIVTF